MIDKEKSPSHAFGIRHSPYIGNLRGDQWVGAKTETDVSARKISYGNAGNSGGPSSSTTTASKYTAMNGTGGTKTTTTTRTHSDGTKIRTETFTYTKAPTTTTRVTTTSYKTNQATLS